ncbi:photosystem II assembly protein Psb34 [Leptothoe spongobia]|uniref:Ssl1498 family light-harvesting-like protein n=1 Tax=Leptothoe spongobia TAU-MAC 1115 TaxID=1967444 RepID=A0A947DG29_9CYAN|nr:ssl1498 family light-harvesting-like protein [Leptothoe spongobia]MBT9316403.1 ssl1498 family light-harvesting-like protein [Leptothoe spongobia TAU-MAC 1115]
MYTTTDETGRLNNYSTEPEMYLASYPAPEQQRRYMLQGGIATLLISALMLTALAVS